MNAWKNHKLSFLLVAGSMLLLLLFQVFWLNNIYQNEKDDLKVKADLVFEDAVRSIEDSLFQRIILDTSAIQMAKDAQIIIKVMDSPDDQNFNPISSTRTEMKILNKDTSIKYNLDMRSNFRQKSKEKSFGSVMMFIASDTSSSDLDHSVLNPIAKQNLLEKKLAKLIPDADFPSPYELVILENKKLPSGDFYSNPHLDLLSQERFVIFFPNYKNYIFQKILPQFLFSIFLFSVMFLSFFMVWQSLEKQRRLTELKNDFISNVTHELKTPITTVGVALEALSNFNALQNPARTEEYLNISKHELQRLSILVDKVLKMSLFEKKEPELKLESFDMNELVENVLRSMKLQFDKFSANVNFQSEGVNFFIKGDKVHLTNVVYNLIDNALKYSKEKPVIELLLKNKNNQLQLIVKDQGIGISQDLKSKIFDKFFRVPQGDLHDVKGYGLGLSYVSGVVKKHHGDIQVNSQIDEGTAFTISLPTNYE
jgi:two-component system phosphate regulon sensor histidine kinase PhoR